MESSLLALLMDSVEGIVGSMDAMRPLDGCSLDLPAVVEKLVLVRVAYAYSLAHFVGIACNLTATLTGCVY